MPARDLTRWAQNDDGTWRRIIPGQDAVGDNGYEDLSKAELEEALSNRGLPKTGNKDDLIKRLEAADSLGT